MLTFLKQLDWLVILAVLVLGGLGLINLYFLAPVVGADFFYRQLIFWVVSLGLLLIFSFFDWELLKGQTGLLIGLYAAALLALMAVLFLGVFARGAVSWIEIGPVSFQPSEFAKIVLVLILAKYYAFRHRESYRVRHLLISALYTLVLTAPVLLQPDLGTALIFFGVWFIVLLFSGVGLRHFGIVLLVALLVSTLAWIFVLAPYQKDRILSFLSPAQDPLGAGYARTQSLIAIGSGGLLGKLFSNEGQAALGYLPEAHTDFAFAALAENLGFIGGFLMLLLFGIIIGRLFWFALFGKNNVQPANFSRLFAGGLAGVLTIQIAINIGMNLGLLPITGIPLPFVSYGGSGLLAAVIGIGIYEGMYRAVN